MGHIDAAGDTVGKPGQKSSPAVNAAATIYDKALAASPGVRYRDYEASHLLYFCRQSAASGQETTQDIRKAIRKLAEASAARFLRRSQQEFHGSDGELRIPASDHR